MSTHWTQSGSGLSDLAAQQHEVDDLLNVCNCVAMLREAHGPTKDRPLRLDKDLGCLFHLVLRYATLFDNLVPRHSIAVLMQTLRSLSCSAQ